MLNSHGTFRWHSMWRRLHSFCRDMVVLGNGKQSQVVSHKVRNHYSYLQLQLSCTVAPPSAVAPVFMTKQLRFQHRWIINTMSSSSSSLSKTRKTHQTEIDHTLRANVHSILVISYSLSCIRLVMSGHDCLWLICLVSYLPHSTKYTHLQSVGVTSWQVSHGIYIIINKILHIWK